MRSLLSRISGALRTFVEARRTPEEGARLSKLRPGKAVTSHTQSTGFATPCFLFTSNHGFFLAALREPGQEKVCPTTPATYQQMLVNRVYARPVSEEIIMGHYMGDGGVLGLSEPTVVSAGSDARYVVFRRQVAVGGIEHYYIEKRSDREGDVSGPFTPDAYGTIATRLALPDFSWHLK